MILGMPLARARASAISLAVRKMANAWLALVFKVGHRWTHLIGMDDQLDGAVRLPNGVFRSVMFIVVVAIRAVAEEAEVVRVLVTVDTGIEEAVDQLLTLQN